MTSRLFAAGAAVVVLASAAVAAPEPVTMLARPLVLGGDQRVALVGAVGSDKAEELVTIQARDCGAGTQSFRNVATARTRAGGSWSTEYFPAITTTLRAVWNDRASAPITVRQRASVRLRRLPFSPRRFEVAVVGKAQFWRKLVLLQRFDRRLATWAIVKAIVLTETAAAGGTSFIWSSAEFNASFPKGTLVRAFLPLSQARPCYLAGVSKLVRT